MVNIEYSAEFRKNMQKVKKPIRELIIKQMRKIHRNPEIGKPMRYSRKGTRELYVAPYRLAYAYDAASDTIRYLQIYHKDEQ